MKILKKNIYRKSEKMNIQNYDSNSLIVKFLLVHRSSFIVHSFLLFLFSLFSISLTAQTITINGYITTAIGQPISNVTVELYTGTNSQTPTQQAIVDAEGFYEFTNVPTDKEIAIRPTKEDDHLNGVSLTDHVMTARHILGIEPFESRDKYIAMDINRSSSITAFDLVQLRKAILALESPFRNNQAWRFVENGQLNALVIEDFNYDENFSDNIDITNITDIVSLNFTGIKIGDASYNAKP